MKLALYRVIGGMKRVALGPLADGVEYYDASKNEDTGVITLTPVTIVGAASKRTDDEDAVHDVVVP